VLGFRHLRDVGAGIFKGDKLATARQRDGSSEGRFQPRLLTGFERLAQPVHREFEADPHPALAFDNAVSMVTLKRAARRPERNTLGVNFLRGVNLRIEL
jgi:hypothetical protein